MEIPEHRYQNTRLKTDHDHLTKNHILGNQAALKHLTDDAPLQRVVTFEAHTLSPEELTGQNAELQGFIYREMQSSSTDFRFPSAEATALAIRNFAELAVKRQWPQEQIRMRLEHNESLAKSMESLAQDSSATYSNSKATSLSGRPYNPGTAAAEFATLFTRNKVRVNKWVDGKHIQKRLPAYNCWSAVAKAACDAEIISSEKAIFACTRNDGVLRLMEHSVKLIDYDKATNEAQTMELLSALPRGTILSLGESGTRSDHVFLCTAPGAFAEVSHFDTDDLIRNRATIQQIFESFPGPQTIWYAFIDDLEDPPPPEAVAVEEEPVEAVDKSGAAGDASDITIVEEAAAPGDTS